MVVGLTILAMQQGCKHGNPAEVQQIPKPPPAYVFTADNAQIKSLIEKISADSLRQDIETLVGFHTRHANSDTLSATTGIGAARRWIFNKFRSISQATGGRLQVSYDEFTEQICGASRRHRNVVALLPGTARPERQILVSGHYDSRTIDRCDSQGFAPGANDDGSGTACVLELARVLSRHEFGATLVFVAFTGEEQGLFGSLHYAGAARTRGDKIIAMATNDIIGNVTGGSGKVDSLGVRCFSDDPMTSPYRQLARYVKLQGEAYVRGFEVRLILARDRPGRGGDHFAFVKQGYTAIRLTDPEDNLEHQHNPNDLPEFMSFSYFRRNVQVNLAWVASLAGAPAGVSEVTFQKQNNGKISLQWQAQADAAKYLVAVRQAASTMYDSVYVVSDATSLTLGNVPVPFYASVAAVSSEGDESVFSIEQLIK